MFFVTVDNLSISLDYPSMSQSGGSVGIGCVFGTRSWVHLMSDMLRTAVCRYVATFYFLFCVAPGAFTLGLSILSNINMQICFRRCGSLHATFTGYELIQSQPPFL